MTPIESAVKAREAPEALADPFSAMTPRFNFLFRGFARRFFRDLELEPETVRGLSELESRGAVVYVNGSLHVT